MYNPATGRNEVILLNTASEVAIGNGAASNVAKQYKISEDQQAIDRVTRLGERVAAAADRQDLQYKFYLIEDKTLNAFTIPGGHVYVFRGLYDILDDNELACVIAHEIGHVNARHVVKRMQTSLGYQVLSTIALSLYTTRYQDAKKTAAYIAYGASTAFNLVQLGYSRQDEYQADEIGIRYAKKAGLDPNGMATSLQKLQDRQEKGMSVPYILRSHPYLTERIARLKELVSQESGIQAAG